MTRGSNIGRLPLPTESAAPFVAGFWVTSKRAGVGGRRLPALKVLGLDLVAMSREFRVGEKRCRVFAAFIMQSLCYILA